MGIAVIECVFNIMNWEVMGRITLMVCFVSSSKKRGITVEPSLRNFEIYNRQPMIKSRSVINKIVLG